MDDQTHEVYMAKLDELLPRDEGRFARFYPEPQAKLPPDFRLPTGEEMAKQTLENMAKVRKRYDGN